KTARWAEHVTSSEPPGTRRFQSAWFRLQILQWGPSALEATGIQALRVFIHCGRHRNDLNDSRRSLISSTLWTSLEFASLLAGRILSRGFNLPRAFFDDKDLSHCYVVQRINSAARPSHFNCFHFGRLAEAEMNAQVVLRIVATAAANLVNLRPAVSDDLDPRACRRPIRFHPDQLDRNPVVTRRR